MKKILLTSLLLSALCASVSAAVIQLTPDFGPAHTTLSTFYIDKNGTGPGNGNDTTSQLYRLNTYFLNAGAVTLVGSYKPSDANQTNIWPTGLSGYSYAVVHFGAGAPQGGAGGSIGAWALNGADTFNFPTQGFSSIDFFGPRSSNVPGAPDGGTTAALLGLALAGLAVARRFGLKS